MSRIDERLEVMGVDTTGMTNEEKFTAATGLTRYDADMAANDWYVPAGAANTPSTASEPSGEQGQTSQTETSGEQGQTSQADPTGEQGQTSQAGPTGEPTGEPEITGQGDTNPSTAAIETGEPVVETYTAEEAIAHNAQLPGALEAGEPLTEEQAGAYNIVVTGAAKEAGDELSEAEAIAYNAHLEGAVSEGDAK